MSRAKRILVAFDGSAAGRRALEAAAELVGYGSTLTVVGADASRYLSARHVFARSIDGHGQTVVETAAEVEADVIVLAAPHAALDSVLQAALCDVLVVR
jgi:nucleotide-binding universal stress UspA family protein